MRRINILSIARLFFVTTVINFNAEARTALLIIHYGSSDDATRLATIDRITSDMRAAFPETEVREAYISRPVRENLAKRGIKTDSPVEALLRLRVEGYDSVYVQSTTIIDGTEMAVVRESVSSVRPFFSFINVGNPLLETPEDCQELVNILADYPCSDDEAVVYVGHGNMLPSTATYTQLDYIFANRSLTRFHVSTIEGYPDVKATLNEVGADKGIKKLILIPLLLVCGNHTKHDIAEDFAGALRQAGFEVEIKMRGLGEVRAVRNLYVEKARALMQPVGE